MKRLLLAIALLLASSTAVLIVLDLLADRMLGVTPGLDLPHILGAALLVLVNLVVMGCVAWAFQRMAVDVRRTNERLELTQAAAGAGTWDWDIRSGRVIWSPLMFDLFGLDRRTTAASFDAWRSVLHPEDRDVAEARIHQALKLHTDLENEYRIIRPDSQVRWISALGKGSYDQQGRAVRMSGISLDITERKRAEEALRESEQKYRRQATILSQINDAVIVMDKDSRITYWNAGAERLYGYRAEEVLGQNPDLFPTSTHIGTTREELARRLCEFGEASVESMRLTRDGRQVWIESRAMMLPDDGDEPGGSIWVDRDITPRILAEESLRRAESELLLAGQEQAALEERQRLARDLHDSVSQVFYGISLGAHTALAMLDTDPGKVREALDFTLSLANSGLTEMRGLIVELRPDSLGEEGLVAALTRQAEQLGARRNVQIELNLCDEPDLSLAAKDALYRIAQEAMLNAARHARSDWLNVRLDCESNVCCLEVSDNGVGFDPLAPYPGHLGLRSMRERAISVGGTLTIISAPECGTQIRAQIPILARTQRG